MLDIDVDIMIDDAVVFRHFLFYRRLANTALRRRNGVTRGETKA